MATIADNQNPDVSIGRIYSRAFGTIRSNPGATLGLAFLFGALPGLGMALLLPMLLAAQADQPTSLGLGFMASIVLVWVVSIAIAALTQAVLTRVTVAYSEGRKASFGESLAAGLSVILPLILLAIAIGICVGLGFMFLVVPGVILYCMFAVASPALIEERRGVFGSLERSRELTRGYRWRVFGAILLMLVIYWLVSTIAGLFGTSMITGAMDPLRMTPAFIITSIAVGTLTNVIWGTMQASMYVELKEAKEGPGHASLEEVFA